MSVPNLNGEEIQQATWNAVIIFKVEQDLQNHETPWMSLGRFLFVWEFPSYIKIPPKDIKKI